MTLPLEQVKVAFLCANGVEQIELEAPLNAVRQAGATASIASIEKGAIESIDGHDGADSFDVDSLVGDIEARDFAALVIPGGGESLGALASDCDMRIEELIEFNRTGTIAWFLNGKLLRRRNFNLGQIWMLNLLTPLMRWYDRFLPVPALSLIAVMTPVETASSEAGQRTHAAAQLGGS